MGNARSTLELEEEDIWWKTESKPMDNNRAKELDEFKLELARKHERRRQLIAEKHKELQELRDEVKSLREENATLKKITPNTNELSAIEEIKKKNLELKMTIANLQKDLQDLNGEVANFEKDKQDYKAHVVALKDVISLSKQMLVIREAQLKELKDKIKEIELSLESKELKALSQDLKEEYEKQLQNMKNLKLFYEERQRADRKEKEEMRKFLDELKKDLLQEKNRNLELGENVDRLEEENSKKYDEIKSLESTLGLTKAECRQYQAELNVINQLFAQILLGFNNNQEVDIDKLMKLLEENHHLLQDIAVNEESNQVSALPKVLLDLVNEVNQNESNIDQNKDTSDSQNSHQMNSVIEIVENLPKVWKVLIELLSHQSAPINNDEKNENPCYKVVETPKGPHLALSVSKTFIRLKDLILEKKSLERETCRLKHLNTHLEGRLQDQENRLELVTKELSETWHVVGKLQKKHQLLHTQEKILRYELAQKRKLLTELKEELEYSREKWQEAREKNSNSQKQWEELRIEFASRKNTTGEDNSVESGYSDDKECSSEDEPSYDESKELRDVTAEKRKVEDDVTELKSGNVAELQSSDVDVTELKSYDAAEPQSGGVSEPQICAITLQQNGDVTEITSCNATELQSCDATEPQNSGVTELKDCDATEPQSCGITLPQNGDVTELKSCDAAELQSSDVTELKDCGVTEQQSGDVTTHSKTVEEVLSTREQRLLRLESMCQGLVKQVTDTTNRGAAISNKLDVLHEMYGEGSGEGSPDREK